MKGLLSRRSPSRPEPDGGAAVVEIDDEAADEVFDALSSATTRSVLAAVYEEPGTASEVADRVDTSIQNATYHIEKLRDADLVAVADTWYSRQGNEMKVYAPTRNSVVVLAGDDDTRASIRETLARLLGAVALVAVASLAVDRLLRIGAGSPYQVDGRTGAVRLLLPVSPGLLFFCGGLTALLLAAALARVQRARSRTESGPGGE